MLSRHPLNFFGDAGSCWSCDLFSLHGQVLDDVHGLHICLPVSSFALHHLREHQYHSRSSFDAPPQLAGRVDGIRRWFGRCTFVGCSIVALVVCSVLHSAGSMIFHVDLLFHFVLLVMYRTTEQHPRNTIGRRFLALRTLLAYLVRDVYVGNNTAFPRRNGRRCFRFSPTHTRVERLIH